MQDSRQKVVLQLESFVKEERDFLQTIKWRKANWIVRILRRNCLLKQVIEGKIERTGGRGRRRKQLLDTIIKREEIVN